MGWEIFTATSAAEGNFLDGSRHMWARRRQGTAAAAVQACRRRQEGGRRLGCIRWESAG